MLEFFLERIVLQYKDNATAQAVSRRRLPTAQFEVQYFVLMKPTAVRNVMCGAGTEFVLLRAQATYDSESNKDTRQCITCCGITQLLRSAHTVCPHDVYRMAVKNGGCSHHSFNTGLRIAKWAYCEVPN